MWRETREKGEIIFSAQLVGLTTNRGIIESWQQLLMHLHLSVVFFIWVKFVESPCCWSIQTKLCISNFWVTLYICSEKLIKARFYCIDFFFANLLSVFLIFFRSLLSRRSWRKTMASLRWIPMRAFGWATWSTKHQQLQMELKIRDGTKHTCCE